MTTLPTLSFLQPYEKIKYNQLIISLENIQDTTGIHVTDSTSLNQAAVCLSQYNALDKEIEKTRKYITEPLNALVKETNTFFKSLSIEYPIQSEIKRLKEESLVYSNAVKAKVEAIRKAEQAKLEEEALNNAIASGKDQPAIIVENITPTYKVSQDTAFANTTAVKKWRIINLDLIPDDFFLLDEIKINSIRRSSKANDISSIPGIEFYTEDSLRIR